MLDVTGQHLIASYVNGREVEWQYESDQGHCYDIATRDGGKTFEITELEWVPSGDDGEWFANDVGLSISEFCRKFGIKSLVTL